MGTSAKIKMLLKFPPQVIAKKIWNRVGKITKSRAYHRLITNNDLRQSPSPKIAHQFFKLNKADISELSKETSQYLVDMYTAHRFDLLGSGWVCLDYNEESFGLENYQYDCALNIHPDTGGDWLSRIVIPKHLHFSKKLWSLAMSVNPNYKPIDWQRDFKTGFRYNARVDFHRQRQLQAEYPGVDLKVPWELSRLQHLPQLAVLGKKLGKEVELCLEYICQSLDFMASNPIAMGVNFNCPMDIGIRVANMLMAYDLFKDYIPSSVKSSFDEYLSAYVYQSTVHICKDMEYREGLTSNHYLGNVLGILFCGAYLNSSPKNDQFLAYGVQELQRSMDRQFFEDGGNFEGSTSYHRLSGEMMAAGAFLVLSFGKEHRRRLTEYDHQNWPYEGPLFPYNEQVFDASNPKILNASFYSKLYKSANFTKIISKNSGRIPQFGDNDSGRFFKFTPIGSLCSQEEIKSQYIHLNNGYFDKYPAEQFWDEDGLTHSPFLGAMKGLGKHLGDYKYSTLECSLFAISSIPSDLKAFCEELPSTFSQNAVQKDNYQYRETFELQLLGSISEHGELKTYYYPDFQLVVIRNAKFHLCLVGMSNHHQHHSLSHVHNDKLQVELSWGDEDLLRDPGTFLYTPLPSRRMAFRSAKAHNVAIIGDNEQNRPLEGKLGLFNMQHDVQFELVELTENKVSGLIKYRGIEHQRTIEILDDMLVIEDSCNHSFHPNFKYFPFYSNGYGKLSQSKALN
jgi:hypothetical protein